MKYVIIGFSAAGFAAATSIRELDKQSEIVVVADEPYPVYSRCLLTYYLSGQIDENKLFLSSRENLTKLRLSIKMGYKVVRVDPTKKQVILSTGDEISYEKLLLASGAVPIVPSNAYKNNKQIHCLRTYTDIKFLMAQIGNAKKAFILGDGLVAVTTALAISKLGLEVTMAGIAPQVMGQFLDEKAARIVNTLLKRAGIAFIPKTTINKWETDDGGLIKRVQLSNGDWIPSNIIILAVGIHPNTNFLKDSGINIDKGVLVNEYLETNISGIYAAGDVAQKHCAVSGSKSLVSLWPIAVEEGRIAGKNMVGCCQKYAGALSMNSVNIEGVSIIAAGLSDRTDDNGYEILESYNPSSLSYRKLVISQNKLVGYILVGDTRKSGILSALIKNKTDISTVKDYLHTDRLNYAKVSLLHSENHTFSGGFC